MPRTPVFAASSRPRADSPSRDLAPNDRVEVGPQRVRESVREGILIAAAVTGRLLDAGEEREPIDVRRLKLWAVLDHDEALVRSYRRRLEE